MTRRSVQTALAALALFIAITFALWVATGTPLHWTKGVVLPGSCTREGNSYACQVELVPDGTHVTVRSDAALAAGRGVELRVWHDMVSGTDTYTVVR
ncbi:hypothetical protein [Lysobacter niastensis]|uniref:DUF4333 domain-containing protein n=1 Tax=Lysobacter niastensis TaxID=380629 RepID=A0ABS0B4A2_9GAMM|nr:hypothetical protein [Lysobacter niastensis]MBF6023409.1 hypothetical protein [Lysobacter niastensis]